MDIAAILQTLEASSLAETIRNSLYLFPLFESIHVIGLALVFGTIMVIDLRLMGVASLERPFQLMAKDILKWTWVAFAITLITGALMFITNATVYYEVTYFRVKMLLLALSGVNMAIFELTTGRRSGEWGVTRSVPRAGRIAAGLSLFMWIGVIVTGRLIGFETSNSAPQIEEAPSDLNFDDFLEGLPDEPPAPETAPENQ